MRESSLQIFAIRQRKKSERDNIDVRKSNIYHLYLTTLLKMEIFQKKIVVTKNDLIKDVDLPSYKALNLTKLN